MRRSCCFADDRERGDIEGVGYDEIVEAGKHVFENVTPEGSGLYTVPSSDSKIEVSFDENTTLDLPYGVEVSFHGIPYAEVIIHNDTTIAGDNTGLEANCVGALFLMWQVDGWW